MPEVMYTYFLSSNKKSPPKLRSLQHTFIFFHFCGSRIQTRLSWVFYTSFRALQAAVKVLARVSHKATIKASAGAMVFSRLNWGGICFQARSAVVGTHSLGRIQYLVGCWTKGLSSSRARARGHPHSLATRASLTWQLASSKAARELLVRQKL